MSEKIDVTYDLTLDSKGYDPDLASKTLKCYHKLLWDKCLPIKHDFHLDFDYYLYHKSDLGEFFLSSDTMVNTFTWKRKEICDIIEQIPEEEMKHFTHIANTIGNRIIFPCEKIDNKNTINQERYWDARIRDRFDLTLECIRRYYNDKDKTNPLGDTLCRYKNYFDLFIDFKGYCEFFLLQDLVSDNYETIKWFLPFDDFNLTPIPTNAKEYSAYKEKSIEFISKRNDRIQSLFP
jgi:hypothetical protein